MLFHTDDDGHTSQNAYLTEPIIVLIIIYYYYAALYCVWCLGLNYYIFYSVVCLQCELGHFIFLH